MCVTNDTEGMTLREKDLFVVKENLSERDNQ